jgi:RNA polymerase sigma-70 factor (ECF subfamily)
MNRLRARDQAAATEVFRRFAARLVGLARSKLDPQTRRKVDPEDVVQSAYRSFFTRYGAGSLAISTWNELWCVLTVITVRKCSNQVTHFRAGRRSVSRETSAHTWEDFVGAIDREPTASEAAMLAETVERLMLGLNPDDRAIIELSLQGYTVPEISARLGPSERTVRRLRERVRLRLLDRQEKPAAAHAG